MPLIRWIRRKKLAYVRIDHDIEHGLFKSISPTTSYQNSGEGGKNRRMVR